MTIETLAKKTDKDRLDDLINWYEKNKPDAGRVIPVKLREKELATFATADANNPVHWHYRGRILERPFKEKRKGQA